MSYNKKRPRSDSSASSASSKSSASSLSSASASNSNRSNASDASLTEAFASFNVTPVFNPIHAQTEAIQEAVPLLNVITKPEYKRHETKKRGGKSKSKRKGGKIIRKKSRKISNLKKK